MYPLLTVPTPPPSYLFEYC